MLPVCSVRDVPGLYLVCAGSPPPGLFISVDFNRFTIRVTRLESILASYLASVDSKEVVDKEWSKVRFA
jgi:hypothetical protein